MSQSPPSSGRFGHPVLDKIIQGHVKQAAEADKARSEQAESIHPALAGLNEFAHAFQPPVASQPVHPALANLNALAHALRPSAGARSPHKR